MINMLNIKGIFIELDKALKAKNLVRDFTIFGSGALLIQKFSTEDRATLDIDMLDPEIDPDLQIVSMDISQKLGLEISWLNSAGYIFSKNFPEGWKERSVLVFEGDNLKVSSLSKNDLMASKILAYCQRRSNTDLIDLESLLPTNEDLINIGDWLSKRPDYKKIKNIFNELQKKIREDFK